MKNRRICHISTVHHPLDTRIFSRECISLSEKYDLTLFAASPSIDNNKVNHRKLPASKKLICRLLISHPLLLIKLLFSKKFAVYHLHDPELLPLGLLLHFFRCKVIYDVHEWFEEDILNKKLPFKKQLIGLYKWVENIALEKLYFILAEESYEQLYKNRLHNYSVILNYPDQKAIQNYGETNRHSKKLFYVGNLTGNRGLKQMIRLLNLLNDKNEFFELICIGRIDNSLKKYLSNVHDYPKVKDQIHFKNYMAIQDAMHFSTDCLAGMALYDNLPNHSNSLSTKMFEYMAVGLPVISSDFELYTHIIEQNNCGFCIELNNTEKLAEAVLELYYNPQLAKNMANNGIKAIEKYYNWESEKQKLFELYKISMA